MDRKEIDRLKVYDSFINSIDVDRETLKTPVQFSQRMGSELSKEGTVGHSLLGIIQLTFGAVDQELIDAIECNMVTERVEAEISVRLFSLDTLDYLPENGVRAYAGCIFKLQRAVKVDAQGRYRNDPKSKRRLLDSLSTVFDKLHEYISKTREVRLSEKVLTNEYLHLGLDRQRDSFLTLVKHVAPTYFKRVCDIYQEYFEVIDSVRNDKHVARGELTEILRQIHATMRLNMITPPVVDINYTQLNDLLRIITAL